MDEIEYFIFNLIGDFVKQHHPLSNFYNNTNFKISYSAPLSYAPTIDVVIFSPFIFCQFTNEYYLNEEKSLYFFIYDKELDMIIGNIERIYYDEFDEDCKNNIEFLVFTAEDRLSNCECPKCSFWLVERNNSYGHTFLGCSNYPECNYSIEISTLC